MTTSNATVPSATSPTWSRSHPPACANSRNSGKDNVAGKAAYRWQVPGQVRPSGLLAGEHGWALLAARGERLARIGAAGQPERVPLLHGVAILDRQRLAL